MVAKINYLLPFSLCILLLSQTSCTRTDNSKSINSLLNIADHMRAQGNEKTSSSFYQQVLDKDPKNLKAHIGIGKMLRGNKEYDAALKQFQIALMHHPDTQDVQAEIVKTYIMMNQGKSAALETRSLTQKDPQNPSFHNLFGISLDLQGKHLEAQKFYRQSLKLQTDQPRVQSNLGLSLALSGNYQEAITLLEQVTRHSLSTPKDRHNLAIAYAVSGDLEKAESTFRIDLDEIKAQENVRYLSELDVKKEGLKSLSGLSNKSPSKNLNDLYLQVGIYKSQENSLKILKKLKGTINISSIQEKFKTSTGKQYYRVLVGSLDNREKGTKTLKALKSLGFKDSFFITRKKVKKSPHDK